MRTTEEIVADIELFMKKMRGIPAYKIQTAMTWLQNGVDFRGCSKRDMAESWATRNNNVHHRLSGMTLDAILAKVEEVYPGGKRTMGPHPDPTPPPPRPPVNNSRSQFEQWLSRVKAYTNFARNPVDTDNYRDPDTDWLWQAWKAGRKSF